CPFSRACSCSDSTFFLFRHSQANDFWCSLLASFCFDVRSTQLAEIENELIRVNEARPLVLGWMFLRKFRLLFARIFVRPSICFLKLTFLFCSCVGNKFYIVEEFFFTFTDLLKAEISELSMKLLRIVRSSEQRIENGKSLILTWTEQLRHFTRDRCRK